MLVHLIDVRYGMESWKLLTEVIIFLAFCTAAFSTRSWQLIIIFSLLLCSVYAEFDEIVKVSLYTNSIVTLVIIFLSLLNVIPDYTYVHDGITAHSYGFYYYSNAAYIFLYCVVMFLHLKRGKVRIWNYLEIIVLNIVVYQVFTTRLVYYLVFVLLIIYLVFSRINLNRMIWKVTAAVIYPLMLAVSVLSTHLYMESGSGSFWRMIDEMLSFRISFNARALVSYGVKLFGQYIPMIGGTDVVYGNASESSYFFVDCGYYYSLLCYGIIPTMIFIIIFSYMGIQACKNNDREIFVWLLLLAVFMLVNNYWLSVATNPILLYLFYGRKSRSHNDGRIEIRQKPAVE